MDSPRSPGILKEGNHLVPQGWSNLKFVPNGSLSTGLCLPNGKRPRIARFGGMRKTRKRAVLKNGECNVQKLRISRRRLRLMQDIFTTLVDAQWRWTLIAFALSFILSWLAFAVVWWLIAFTHGDLEPLHLPDNQADSNWKPCMSNINNYASCFLFSIETQHTIGYGSRLTTEECPEAIFLMCIQSIFGVMMQAFMVGIVFAKMTRQKSQTLIFSKYALICQRDGELCLTFRVGDMRKSHIIGASIRAHLIKSKMTREGECLTQHQSDISVTADSCESDFFFVWPLTIVHKINSDSPLYSYSACDLLDDRFEIVVILEGTIESTGQSAQVRSSYVSSEILWGHRFDPIMFYSKERQIYEVDYSKFNETTQVDTPLCSAKEWDEYYKVQEDYRIIEHGSMSRVAMAASDTQSQRGDSSIAVGYEDPEPAETQDETVFNVPGESTESEPSEEREEDHSAEDSCLIKCDPK